MTAGTSAADMATARISPRMQRWLRAHRETFNAVIRSELGRSAPDRSWLLRPRKSFPSKHVQRKRSEGTKLGQLKREALIELCSGRD